MPLFVGSGSAEDGGFESSSSQTGIPTATTDPVSANVGDVYVQTVGGGATMRLYNGTSWEDAGKPRDITGNIGAGGSSYSPADSLYEVRVFDSPGSITISNEPIAVEMVLIAGGGSAWYGGGGAGGVIGTSFTLSTGTYPIGIGTGGATVTTPSTIGWNGGDSTFNGFTAIGGGAGGGSTPTESASPGGSGGGGASGPGINPAGIGITGQGFPGGYGGSSSGGGGGGGVLSAGTPLIPVGTTYKMGNGGFGGGLQWDLPPSVPGTIDGITRIAGGGGGTAGGAPPTLGYHGGIPGSYGAGAQTVTSPSPVVQVAGSDGALFLRFKKLQ